MSYLQKKAEQSYLFDAAVGGGFFTVVHHLLKDKNKPNAMFVVKHSIMGLLKHSKRILIRGHVL